MDQITNDNAEKWAMDLDIFPKNMYEGTINT